MQVQIRQRSGKVPEPKQLRRNIGRVVYRCGEERAYVLATRQCCWRAAVQLSGAPDCSSAGGDVTASCWLPGCWRGVLRIS